MKKISVLLLLLGFGFLYSFLLNRTPIHLNQDELGFSLNAYSIAKTGFDENGRFFPLYFWHLGVMWAAPFIVYLTALFLLVFPLSEIVVRLPSVLVAVCNILLIYVVGRKIFKSHLWGLASAVLLGLTPAHFIHGRILLDTLYIVPFALGWLLLLIYFLEKKNQWILFAIGVVLGIGIHSYHAAKIMIPIYLLLTLVFAYPYIKGKKSYLLLLIGFVLPLVPLVPWLALYPDTLLDQVRYTGLYDTKLNPFSGIATLLTPEIIFHKISVFISYFDPFFLFLLGDASLIHSTSLRHPLGISQSIVRAGVFLFPFAVFLPIGIFWIVKIGKNRFFWLFITGFFTAPVAAALVGDHYRISRSLAMLPFAALIAVCAIRFLVSQKVKLLRALCYLLLIVIPLQFSYFVYDYFTDYRIRSYNWMRYNIPGALEEIILQEKKVPAKVIYIDRRTEFIDRYWKFYLIKHNEEELFEKTVFFEPRDIVIEDLENNSIIMYNMNDVDGLKTEVGPFKKVASIFEPDGVSVFYIYRN